MNPIRRNTLLVASLVVVCALVSFVWIFQRRSGPLDTFPRLYAAVQCSDSSHTAALYLRKTVWVCPAECVEALVQVRDAQNIVVYNERLTTLDTWRDITEIDPRLQCTDSSVKVTGRQPDFVREFDVAELKLK